MREKTARAWLGIRLWCPSAFILWAFHFWLLFSQLPLLASKSLTLHFLGLPLSASTLLRDAICQSYFSMEKDNMVQTPDFVMCGGSANLTTIRLESLIRRNILWLGFEAKHQGKRLKNSGGKKTPSLIKQLKFARQRNSSCPEQNSWKAAL